MYDRRTFLRRAGLATAGAALLAGLPRPAAAQDAGLAPFLHGIASGDPLPDGVVLWTRVTAATDNKVWVHDVASATITVLYDAADFGTEAPLTGVDNIVVSRSGDLFIAEDGGNMEIDVITPDRTVAPFLRYLGNDQSELTGPVFDPSSSRLY